MLIWYIICLYLIILSVVVNDALCSDDDASAKGLWNGDQQGGLPLDVVLLPGGFHEFLEKITFMSI